MYITSGISEKYICPKRPLKMPPSFTGVIYEVTIPILKALSGVWTLLTSPLVLPRSPPQVSLTRSPPHKVIVTRRLPSISLIYTYFDTCLCLTITSFPPVL